MWQAHLHNDNNHEYKTINIFMVFKLVSETMKLGLYISAQVHFSNRKSPLAGFFWSRSKEKIQGLERYHFISHNSNQKVFKLIQEFRELKGDNDDKKICSGAKVNLVACYNCKNPIKLPHSRNMMKTMHLGETMKLVKHFMEYPNEWGNYISLIIIILLVFAKLVKRMQQMN